MSHEWLEGVHALVEAEIAAIGGIDGAIARQKEPDYTTLFHDSKDGHQANVGQLRALLKRRGSDGPLRGGSLVGFLLRAQTELLQSVNTSATLRAMRGVEAGLRERYRTLCVDGAALLGDEAPEVRALRRALGRVEVHWHLLTAHLARRGDLAEAEALPRPLGEYFAGEQAKACLRCHLDRPGVARALERPDPYTYVCAACHDEVAARFPDDLREQMPDWPDALREDKVVEKALGRPAKETARKEVLTVLSGLPPEPVRREAPPLRARLAAHLATAPEEPCAVATRVELPVDGAPEGAYVELLMDPRALRAFW